MNQSTAATAIKPTTNFSDSIPADYQVFFSSNFDPNQYTNCVLSGKPYSPDNNNNKENSTTSSTSKLPLSTTTPSTPQDVTALYSKLTTGLDDVNKQLRNEIGKHHKTLLNHASSLDSLSKEISKVNGGLDEVSTGVSKLHRKVSTPYQDLESMLTRSKKLEEALDFTRRTARFTTLVRRLEQQAKDFDDRTLESNQNNANSKTDGDNDDLADQALADAALTLSEIDILLSGESTYRKEINPNNNNFISQLASIPQFKFHIDTVQRIRERVIDTMEDMVRDGLGESNQAVLASALQIAYNLRFLPTLVASLVTDLTEQIESRIQYAFDISDFSKEMSAKDAASGASPFSYRSRARNEPTNLTLPQWTASFWKRLENLFVDIGGCCIKVYSLEKVLRLKRDPTSQVSFLATVSSMLENKPSGIFWTTLARSLESESQNALQSSSFIRQTLSHGYPKLLRLLNDFFTRMTVYTDTVYTNAQQSPEAILVIRSLSHFETMYLKSQHGNQ